VVDDTFRGRAAVSAMRCREAREAVTAEHAASVETFIATTFEQARQERAVGERQRQRLSGAALFRAKDRHGATLG
jgi:hypothetical protein